jgi:hypothetical protein
MFLLLIAEVEAVRRCTEIHRHKFIQSHAELVHLHSMSSENVKTVGQVTVELL